MLRAFVLYRCGDPATPLYRDLPGEFERIRAEYAAKDCDYHQARARDAARLARRRLRLVRAVPEPAA